MKISTIVLMIAILVFVLNWILEASGNLIEYYGNLFSFDWLAVFLAIISVYLKLNELDKKKSSA